MQTAKQSLLRGAGAAAPRAHGAASAVAPALRYAYAPDRDAHCPPRGRVAPPESARARRSPLLPSSAQSARSRAASAALGAAPAPGRAAVPAPRLAAAAGRASVAAAASPTNEYQLYTLNTWLLEQEKVGRIDSELATVLSSITLACKQIGSLVARAGIADLTGLAGAENISGEAQKKLDVVSNEVFCNCLRSSGRTGVIASEEEDAPVAVEGTTSGEYVVVFDPLDGSSNLDCGVSVGSIFGIYAPSEECRLSEDDFKNPEASVAKCITNVCKAGNELLGAGYCLYSSSTVMVLTLGDGVYGFTLDTMVGEFILTHPNIKIPDHGKQQKIYAFNEGNYNGCVGGRGLGGVRVGV